MTMPKVKEVDVDALLASGRLSVSGTHGWTQAGERCWFKASIPVEDTDRRGPSLRITVTVSFLDQTRCTFALLWNKQIRVRCLCIGGNHTNKHTNSERWYHQMHKHKWSDVCQERFAYSPKDITATDLQDRFAQFCRECGIACKATLGPLPATPKGLIDDL